MVFRDIDFSLTSTFTRCSMCDCHNMAIAHATTSKVSLKDLLTYLLTYEKLELEEKMQIK